MIPHFNDSGLVSAAAGIRFAIFTPLGGAPPVSAAGAAESADFGRGPATWGGSSASLVSKDCAAAATRLARPRYSAGAHGAKGRTG